MTGGPRNEPALVPAVSSPSSSSGGSGSRLWLMPPLGAPDRRPTGIPPRGEAYVILRTSWAYARDHGYTIVSKDNDFRQYAFLYGPPPKVLWLPACLAQRRGRRFSASAAVTMEMP